MSVLFSGINLRSVEFRNRVFVSPMCQYSADEGMPNDWHLVHLGSRAVGGAGLVMAEATAVSPIGRISPGDTGMWAKEHVRAFHRIADFIRHQGAVAGIQLGHAGRKASTDVPWRGGKGLSEAEGGWPIIAPSPIPFAEGYPVPREMTEEDIDELVGLFEEATRNSLEADFQLVEIHMAHGYLLHEFLSPLSNHRTDEYGGSFERRIRLPLKVADSVRRLWPSNMPVFVRISTTDWVEGGWDVPQSVEFSRELKKIGVDLIDCSGGGILPGVTIPIGPGFQVPFAAQIREEVGIATGAVGLITTALQAEEILATGQADAVFLARAELRDPYWPLHASKKLGADAPWPVQYQRAID